MWSGGLSSVMPFGYWVLKSSMSPSFAHGTVIG